MRQAASCRTVYFNNLKHSLAAVPQLTLTVHFVCDEHVSDARVSRIIGQRENKNSECICKCNESWLVYCENYKYSIRIRAGIY